MHTHNSIVIICIVASIVRVHASDDYSFFADQAYEGLQEQKRQFDQKVNSLVNENKIKKQTRQELEAKSSWSQWLSQEEHKKLDAKIEKEQNRRIKQARDYAVFTVKQQEQDELLKKQQRRAEVAKKVGSLVRGSLQKPARFDSEIENFAYQELETQKIQGQKAAEQALRTEWEDFRKKPQFQEQARQSLTKKGILWGTVTPYETDVQKEADRLAQNAFTTQLNQRKEKTEADLQQQKRAAAEKRISLMRKSFKNLPPFTDEMDAYAYKELNRDKKQAQKKAVQQEQNEWLEYAKDKRFEQEAHEVLTQEIPFFSIKHFIKYGSLFGGKLKPSEEEVRIEAEKRARASFNALQKINKDQAQRLQQETIEANARALTAAEQKAGQRLKSFIGKADTEKIKGSLIEGYSELSELRERNAQAERAAQEQQRYAEVDAWNAHKNDPRFTKEAETALNKNRPWWSLQKATTTDIAAEAERRARTSYTPPQQNSTPPQEQRSWFPSLNLSRFKPMGGTGLR
jgi:hypothetical protein